MDCAPQRNRDGLGAASRLVRRMGLAWVLVALSACGGDDSRWAPLPVDGAEHGLTDLPPGADAELPTGGVATVTGVVTLGPPVVGAQIEIRSFSNFEEGAVLARAVTDQAGVYEATLEAPYHGRLLIRAWGEGAFWTELGTGEVRTFDADDELQLVTWYDAESGLAGGMVNGLTTLAAWLARAYVADLGKPQEALSLANQRLTEHLIPGGFDPAATPVADLSVGPEPWPKPRTALGLFHAGLSHLAAELTATGPLPVTTVNVVGTLGLDLADAVFNGEQKPGVPLQILAHHPIDADTTRWTLAHHTDAWLQAGAFDSTDLTYDTLAADGGFLTMISTDAGPLYPAEPPPQRYDTQPPDLTWRAPTPAAGQAVNGPFEARVAADDASPLAGLEVDAPGAEAAVTLKDTTDHTSAITVHAQLVPEGELTLVATAVDASGNSAQIQRTIVVDRTPPTLTVAAPEATSAATALVTGTALDEVAGVSEVQILYDGPSPEVTLAADGTFEAWLALTPQVAAPVMVVAVDRAGNETTWEGVVVMDAEAPDITIAAPAPDAWVGPGPFTVQAEVTSLAPLTAVTVEANGTAWSADEATPGVWQASVTPPDTDGLFTVFVTAKDAADNDATHPLALRRDGTPPELLGFSLPGVTVDGVAFVKTGLAAATIMTVDAGSGVSDVFIGSQTAQPAGPQTWEAYIPIAPGPSEVSAAIFDATGNQTGHTQGLVGDGDPPLCFVDPIGKDGQTNDSSPTVTGQWTDGKGAGAVTVTLLGPSGYLTEADVHPDGTWTATLPNQNEGPLGISVVCTDGVGHQSTTSAAFVVDLTAPSVDLLPYPFSDHTGIVDGEPTTQVDFSVRCESHDGEEWFCGSIARAMDEFVPGGLDLPGFAFEPLGVGETRSYRLEGAQWVELHESVVRLSTDNVSWASVPSYIEIRTEDVAGNSLIRRYSFTLNLLASPLTWSPLDWEWTYPWDARNFDLAGGDAHLLAGTTPPAPVKAHGGARLSRYLVENPSNHPVVIRVKGLPPLYTSWIHQHLYLPQPGTVEGCAIFPCGSGECLDEGGCFDRPGSIAGSNAQPQALVLNATPMDQADWFGGTTSVYDTMTKEIEVPANDGVVIDLLTNLQGTCLIPPPTPLAYEPPGNSTSLLADVPGTCSTFGPPAPEQARCQSDACITRQYTMPLAITSLTLATKSGAYAFVEYFVPGHYDLAYPQEQPLMVSHTFSAMDLPIVPE